MENLVRMLDNMWAEYAKYMNAEVFDGANKNNLGHTLPSSFHQTLVHHRWLPAKPLSNPSQGLNVNCYYISSELYEDIPCTRRLLDGHVPYIAVQIKSDLASVLKLKSDVPLNELVRLLKEWKNMSQGMHSFHASIQHMANVYIYLRNQSQESKDASNLLDVITADECIFVPHKLKDHPSSDLVEGKFYSVHKVCWKDSTAVLKDLLFNNHDLPSDIPKPLSLYYLKGEAKIADDLKSAFSHLRVPNEPNLAQLINLLGYISSLSPIPLKKDLQHFLSIIEVIVNKCKDDATKKRFIEENIAERKVFPAHDGWVSLQDYPLESDDESICKIFRSTKGAHFLQWPIETNNEKGIRAIRHDIIKLFKIQLASHCVNTSVVPEFTELNYDLQSKLNNYTQIVQCYLLTKLPAHYETMRHFGKLLHSLRCYSAAKLDVTHALSAGNEKLYAPPTPSKCELDESEFILYVLKAVSNDKSILVDPLCKLFLKSGTYDERKEFKSFIQDLLLRDPSTNEQKLEIMSSYSLQPVGTDEAWSVPYTAPQTQPPVVINNCERTIEWTEEPQTVDVEEEREVESSKRCWPPNAGVSLDSKPQSKACYNRASDADYIASIEDTVSAEDVMRARNRYSEGDGGSDMITNPENESREGPEHQVGSGRNSSVGRPNDQLRNASMSRIRNQSVEPPSYNHPDAISVHRTNCKTANEVERDIKVLPSSSGPSQLNVGPPKQTHYPDMSKEVTINLKPLHMDGDKEYIMTSMAPGSDLTTDTLVGEWGEKLVFLYLNQRKQLPDGREINQVMWMNQSSESFKPYDLLVEGKDGNFVYIEVKSTSGDQNAAAISWNELMFAREHKSNYHVYRVYNAGSTACTVSYIEGLSPYLDKNPTVLYLLL